MREYELLWLVYLFVVVNRTYIQCETCSKEFKKYNDEIKSCRAAEEAAAQDEETTQEIMF